MRMLRPIEAEGTSRYCTGSPGRENADAVADSPAPAIKPGRKSAATADVPRRRNHLPRNFDKFHDDSPSPFYVFVSTPLLCLGWSNTGAGRLPERDAVRRVAVAQRSDHTLKHPQQEVISSPGSSRRPRRHRSRPRPQGARSRRSSIA